MTDSRSNETVFPLNTANNSNPGALAPDPGLSLRDWFAGQAMSAGLYARRGDDPHLKVTPLEFALSAYELADAMLEARKRNNG